MKNILLISIVCLSFAFAKAQSQKNWTLQECVQYAIDNNISIQNGTLDIENNEVDQRGALGNFLPSLNLGAGRTVSQGFQFNPVSGFENNKRTNLSASANMGITLFDGLRNFRQYERAKMQSEAIQYQIQNLKTLLVIVVNLKSLIKILSYLNKM